MKTREVLIKMIKKKHFKIILIISILILLIGILINRSSLGYIKPDQLFFCSQSLQMGISMELLQEHSYFLNQDTIRIFPCKMIYDKERKDNMLKHNSWLGYGLPGHVERWKIIELDNFNPDSLLKIGENYILLLSSTEQKKKLYYRIDLICEPVVDSQKEILIMDRRRLTLFFKYNRWRHTWYLHKWFRWWG
ncbi:MAG: hypothetical protein COT43_08040 [Candidatus Marinimicrobia bacterium CG08_land_8_20_14_0_20_45_22]|nr:MAG: hypothetical protein COT43_08040 [Candidatus Marinimicrobia bacterium CG08_land_8_20_14_0_20_45_22]